MSRENVELVRNAFAAFERGDIDGVLRLCDEDIVITPARKREWKKPGEDN